MRSTYGNPHLKEELAFWATQATHGKIALHAIFGLSFVFCFGASTVSTIFFHSTLGFVSIVFGLVAIGAFFSIVPLSFSWLWFNVLRKNHYASLHGRWIAVYNHLFARDLINQSTRLMYDPFFRNSFPITNEAKFMGAILREVDEKAGQGLPTRVRSEVGPSNQKILDLINAQFRIWTRLFSGKRFGAGTLLVMLFVGVLTSVLIYVLRGQGNGRFVLLFCPPIFLLLGWIVRLGYIRFHIAQFQRQLKATPHLNFALLIGTLEHKWEPQSFLGKLIWPNRYTLPFPIIRYFQLAIPSGSGVFLPLNELRMLILYFGLPFEDAKS